MDPECFRTTTIICAVVVFAPWAVFDLYCWYLVIDKKRRDARPPMWTARVLATLAWIGAVCALVAFLRLVESVQDNKAQDSPVTLHQRFEDEVNHILPVFAVTLVIAIMLLARQWPPTWRAQSFAWTFFALSTLPLLIVVLLQTASVATTLRESADADLINL
ncbi:hypothetical protein EBZ80_18360 [bacterium]|nr:hypothetical protein [bacterium]